MRRRCLRLNLGYKVLPFPAVLSISGIWPLSKFVGGKVHSCLEAVLHIARVRLTVLELVSFACQWQIDDLCRFIRHPDKCRCMCKYIVVLKLSALWTKRKWLKYGHAHYHFMTICSHRCSFAVHSDKCVTNALDNSRILHLVAHTIHTKWHLTLDNLYKLCTWYRVWILLLRCLW
jgi:hypothetical protein